MPPYPVTSTPFTRTPFLPLLLHQLRTRIKTFRDYVPLKIVTLKQCSNVNDVIFRYVSSMILILIIEYLNELHKQRAARQMRKDISEISENNKSKVKKRKLDTKSIHFANKKFNAVGQASVQHKDRVFLDVFFPLDSRVQPLHMFFNRRWVTGKVLDKIAVQGKIPNTNNRVSEEKQLALFNLRTQEKLPNSKTLEQLLQDGKIKQRDNIILERGLELDKQVLELLDNPEKAEQAQQNYCCIN
eukprot:gb/GECH01012395.1/.p1 GENE.gb/GECH01012395.1/~~gb/GECH01012395.1/.p1  ORF type:complete len:243 (+),score=51.31 gb/GECH01012395.1/:1-729(+)